MFEKIQLLQEKHDTEIELLASELNLQSHFIKVKFMFKSRSKFKHTLIKFISI